MKTPNKNLITMLVMIAALALTGCGKKDENHAPPPNPGPIVGPGGYFPAPAGYGFPLANAMGVHYASSGNPSVQMMVNLFGQAQPQNFMGQPTSAMVAGQILFSPEAVNPVLAQWCPIPVGVPLPIQSAQPVTVSSRMITDFKFQAGPMIVGFYQVQLPDLGGIQAPGPNGQLYSNGLAGELVVESVNGIQCQYNLGWFTMTKPQ